jgi:competence protein ComEA
MKKISYWIRRTFDFSQTEANGFIVIMVLIFLFTTVPFIYDFFPARVYKNYYQDKRLLDSLLADMEDNSPPEIKPTVRVAKRNEIIEFFFDPNTVKTEELEKLGLSRRAIRAIIGYRKKGGKFKIKKDVAKIYGLSANKYKQLEKYIDLPDSIPFAKSNYIAIKKEIVKQDINTADTLQLQELKGIGSKRSLRIIKYRELLGGFIVREQFGEIYGLDSIVIASLEKFFYIAKDFSPQKIDINHVSKEALALHPYMNKKSAMIIINYRMHHGNFHSFDDLLKVKAVEEEKLRKVAPYLQY